MPQICKVDFTEERAIENNAERIVELFHAKGYGTTLDAALAGLALPEIADDRVAVSGEAAVRRQLRIRHIAPETYEIGPEWSTRQKPLGLQGFRGSTMGATTKQNFSFTTISRTAAPGVGTAPDFKGAVGVQYTSSGVEIVGVEIDIPGLVFSIDWDYAPGTIDFAWIANIMSYGKHVNSDSWNGFAPGEVKFLGADFNSVVAEQRESVTYNFEASPNVTALSVAGITVPAKAGWDYLWLLFEPTDSNSRLATKAIAAYVERVYRYRSFATLLS